MTGYSDLATSTNEALDLSDLEAVVEDIRARSFKHEFSVGPHNSIELVHESMELLGLSLSAADVKTACLKLKS